MGIEKKSTFHKALDRAEELRAKSPLVLIDSKFAPTQISPAFLSLPRLEEQFDTALTRRLVCLNAPAGYGKTTTLAKLRNFAESRSVRTGWVSLDSEDNDPIRFLHYVVEALQRTIPNWQCSAFAHMPNDNAPSIEAILLSLTDELSKIQSSLALFLDDYHLIDNEAIHNAMNWLISHSPRNLAFFIASRTQLPLKLSKLRLAQGIYEVSAEHLCLLTDEVRAFVQMVSGHDLLPIQVNLLHGRTEGWVAGLQLASLALRKVPDANAFIHAFTGSDREITAYLGEIVLSQLPDHVSAFMKRTALFDRFSIELCGDVLNEQQAGPLIESIQANNLFLVPLDRHGQWYRYHHLFGDYLKSRFMLSSATEAKTLYGTASEWFERKGSIIEAIRYALAAQDYAHGADLMEYSADGLIRGRGEHTTFLNWIAALPRTYIEERPQLRLSNIWSLMLTHRYSQANAELFSLEKMLEDNDELRMTHLNLGGKEGTTFVNIASKALMIRCLFSALTGRHELAGQKSREWLSNWQHTSEPQDVASVFMSLGYSDFTAHDYQGAMHSLMSAREIFAQHSSYYGVAFSELMYAQILMEQGNVEKAEKMLALSYATISEKLGHHSYSASILAMYYAHVCYEQNRVDEAEKILDGISIFVDERHTFGESSLTAYLTKARILWLRGAYDEADSYLEHGTSTAKSLGLKGMAPLLTAQRIHLHIKKGMIEQALRIAYPMGISKRDNNARGQDELLANGIGIRLVDIRLQLATGRNDKAQLLLNDLLVEARRQGRNRRVVQLLCIKAAAQVGNGQRDDALRLLDEALTIGATGGLCRTIVDEGALIGELIQEIADRRLSLKEGHSVGSSQEYLIQLLHASGRKHIQPQYAAPAKASFLPRQNMLSEREIQILRLVDMGLKNRDLAKQLFVSDETIKWHLRNIYAKFNVNNRTSAVAKARELSLL